MPVISTAHKMLSTEGYHTLGEALSRGQLSARYTLTGKNADIPPEILCLIFEHISADILSVTQDFFDSPTTRDLNGVNNTALKGMYLTFPRNLALVCTYWREITRALPNLWTNIVAFIGAEIPYDYKNIKWLFNMSQNLPLTVMILAAETNTERNEEADLRYILRQLQPHLDRIKGIYISTCVFPSALMVQQVLHGPAPILSDIVLQPPRKPMVRYPNPDAVGLTTFRPNVKHLHLSGIDFESSVVRNFLATLKSVTSITIDEYEDRRNARIAIYLPSCLSCLTHLPKLTSLKFRAVDFKIFSRYYGSNRLSTVKKLVFEDMEPDQMLNVWRAIADLNYVPVLVLRSCWVNPIIRRFESASLIVEDLMDDGREEIMRFLHTWNGTRLEMRDCPQFDNVALDILAERVPEYGVDPTISGYGRGMCCEKLNVLVLDRCAVTAAKVREVIQRRIERRPDAEVGIEDVWVRSHCGEVISEELRDWFMVWTKRFTWLPN
ncbi:hypothetical protein D9619_009477 [Psilocybe cf. subviscida]|uniref:F-box domain-containing protein n=1 Tax=Psilocybe cf. subviscida TaxID=2480587 RepID=A0A8H5BVK9_9AGAR|nr:hypothetical protein D9619_009477 [Psilocybe cf. subviscida]